MDSFFDGNSDFRVCGSIIEEPFIFIGHEAFYKTYFIHFPDFFIGFIWPNKGL
jgi:hypothetical protein